MGIHFQSSVKYRYGAVYRLFFCTFENSNRFNMRRLWGTGPLAELALLHGSLGQRTA